MRARLITLAAGAAALATGLAVPATTAQAAAAMTRSAPKPHHSLRVAGYQQTGCHHHGYPVYVEISGTIKVPAATDINGTPGISYDIYSFGGVHSGVNAGVAVDNSGGQAFYTAFGQWNGAPVTAFAVQPGDKLQVTIEDEGSSGYLVEILNESNSQEWAQTNPDSSASRCQVAAYEESPYPAYNHTTRTSPIAFRFTRVWWGEQGQGTASVSKLLGKLPAHAKLSRYTLFSTKGSKVAVTSSPADHSNNFTITDK
jgi:Peptidase A4 family